MSDPITILAQNWGVISVIALAGVSAIAEKMHLDKGKVTSFAQSILDYYDPTKIEANTAPEGIPEVTFTMAADDKAKLIAGKSLEDATKILTQIEQAEKDRKAKYTIEYPDGTINIEYGYIKSQSFTALPLLEMEKIGNFDPREHTAETWGMLPSGAGARGLKMPDAGFGNMVFAHPEAEKVSMREQVDAAEKAGLREYIVKFSGGYYQIDSGIVVAASGMPAKGVA